MARFGLLAVAAKATVLVFAVPHPSALKGEASVSGFSMCQLVLSARRLCPTCRRNVITPSVHLPYLAFLWVSCSALQPVEPLLAIASPVLELGDGTQPVTAVSWSSDEVHEWIAAGRVDGSVAFYNLTSKGQTSPNQTRLVVPEFVVTTNNVIFLYSGHVPDAGLFPFGAASDISLGMNHKANPFYHDLHCRVTASERFLSALKIPVSLCVVLDLALSRADGPSFLFNLLGSVFAPR